MPAESVNGRKEMNCVLQNNINTCSLSSLLNPSFTKNLLCDLFIKI